MGRIELRRVGGGPPLEVAVEPADPSAHEEYVVSFGDRSVHVDAHRVGERTGWIRLDGRVVPFRSLRRNALIEVWVAGRTHVFEIIQRTARRSSAAGEGGSTRDLTAPMPGTVLAIAARVGETFSAHQPLIVMESMKMEMTLSAPHAGCVTQIHCDEGDLVEMGELLATLEPLDASEAV